MEAFPNCVRFINGRYFGEFDPVGSFYELFCDLIRNWASQIFFELFGAWFDNNSLFSSDNRICLDAAHRMIFDNEKIKVFCI